MDEIEDNNKSTVETFTQHQVNHLKIGYMPPDIEIGLNYLNLTLLFNVSCRDEIVNDTLKVSIIPIDNTYPDISIPSLNVEEGGTTLIPLNISDVDTPESLVVVTICQNPAHGNITFKDSIWDVDFKVTATQLNSGFLRYIHDDEENSVDEFELCANDGKHLTRKRFGIKITPKDDQLPYFTDGLICLVTVNEGGSLVINTQMIDAHDADTNKNGLFFHVLTRPSYGLLSLVNQWTNSFTYEQLITKQVSYVHVGGEIGPAAIHDSINLVVCNQRTLPSRTGLLKFDNHTLNVKILPVDGSRTRGQIRRRLVVDEGDHVVIGRRHITVNDADTPPEDIRFILEAEPKWGFVENIDFLPGSEKTGIGLPIANFTYQDVTSKKIRYVQSKHSLEEPRSDHLILKLLEGKSRSYRIVLDIRINPVNDERPVVVGPRKISVAEGRYVILKELQVTDGDLPADALVVSIVEEPQHGKIVHVSNSVPVLKILYDHFRWSAAYSHDDSENFSDEFIINVDDSIHSVNWTIAIDVRPINDNAPKVINNSGIIGVQFGDIAPITNQILLSIDEDLGVGDTVIYRVTTPPSMGTLEKVNNASTIKTNQFTQLDVNKNLIRYAHNGLLSSSSHDAFQFYVSDGFLTTPPYVFRIAIDMPKISPITLHLGPKPQISVNKSFVLDSLMLSAKDTNNDPSAIIFDLQRVPVFGDLSLSGQALKFGDGFTQLDLLSGRLKYQNKRSVKGAFNDVFIIRASNEYSEKTSRFYIEISPPPNKPPILEDVVPLVVQPDGTTVITKGNLDARDNDTRDDKLIYIISKHPRYGILMRRNRMINSDTFTQMEINEGLISYKRKNSSGEASDYFLFKVSDGQNVGRLKRGRVTNVASMRLDIRVEMPLEPTRFDVFVNDIFSLKSFPDRTQGFVLTEDNLKVVDTSNKMILEAIFRVTKSPSLGIMKTSVFSQRDVINGNVRIVLGTNPGSATSDKFSFQVENGMGDVLASKEIVMEWASLSFESGVVIVCESARRVNMIVRRIGWTKSSSFVSIKTDSISAALNEDYVPSRVTQLQFGPGVTSVDWTTQIVADNIREHTEQFKLTLYEPINAVVSPKSSSTIITIRDTGRCNNDVSTTQAMTTARPETCKTGWAKRRNGCYYRVLKSLTQSQALSNCRQLGGELVIPMSKSNGKRLGKLLPRRTFWIGVHQDLPGHWISVTTGKDLGYTNWRSRTAPKLADKKCVAVLPRGHWISKHCNKDRFNSICFRKTSP